MNVGEYMGCEWGSAVYRWRKVGSGYRHEGLNCDGDCFNDADVYDWPAARAALDALIAEEAMPVGDGIHDDAEAVAALWNSGQGLRCGVYRLGRPIRVVGGEWVVGEEAGWVEIDEFRRIKPDGTEPQERCAVPDYPNWHSIDPLIGEGWSVAYRKGREVALNEVIDKGIDEANALYMDGWRHGKEMALEQVRELVEAVEAGAESYRLRADGPHDEAIVSRDWFWRIRDAARAVKKDGQ